MGQGKEDRGKLHGKEVGDRGQARGIGGSGRGG